ncbi:MAG: MBL fold metallo-hydrolase [Deltaproteobacteria bacterium RBG_13_52_11]|nr:MAG: MBL fold metallo-hydrolase [Deltaproteobacteria bacterium RBG_13_52_11]
MIVKLLVVGPIQANCYILGCERTKQAAVIDPGGDVNQILMALAKDELRLVYIINTHGHFDHTGGNRALKAATGAEILIHRADAPYILNQGASAAAWGMGVENSPPPDRYLDEGDTITFGDISLEVLHTPGHSPGGIALVTDKMVFVGDTLFAGSIGRTDFPGGDYDGLIRGVRTKIFTLGDDVVVYPGHGPKTTVAQEKQYNPFFAEGG